MSRLKIKDVIALMCITGYFAAKAFGFDGEMNTAFMLILGYYFVKRQNGEDKGV